MDDLATSLLKGIELTADQISLMTKVVDVPFVSWPQNPAAAEPGVSDREIAFRRGLEKCAFLHALKAVAICASDKSSIHYDRCQRAKGEMDSKDCVQKTLKGFNEVRYGVTLETVIALQMGDGMVLKNQDHLKALAQTAGDAPSHLVPLCCFALLQTIGLKTVYQGNGSPRRMTHEIDDLLTGEIFSPLYFASYLEANEHSRLTQVLQKVDVFDILLRQWLEPVHKWCGREMRKIVDRECYYIVVLFLRMFETSISQKTMSSRILPLLAECIRESPEDLGELMNTHNMFTTRYFRARMDDLGFVRFAAAACNSKENALSVWEGLTSEQGQELLLVQYYEQLKCIISDAGVSEVTDIVKNSLVLMERLCKYLSPDKLHMFIMHYSKSEPVLSFVMSLWHLLDNPGFIDVVIKCLCHVAHYYPVVLAKVLSDSWRSQVIVRYMNHSSHVARWFSRIALVLARNYFTEDSELKSLPHIVCFVAKEYFPTAVFLKYERRSDYWKTVTTLLEVMYEVCILQRHKEIGAAIRGDSGVCRGLLSVTQQIATLWKETRSPRAETSLGRVDLEDTSSAVRAGYLVVSFIRRLVSLELSHGDQLSCIEKTIFATESGSATMFSTLVSFLEVTSPLAVGLRGEALKLIDVMCLVASRRGRYTMDGFYTRGSQAVLTEFIRVNLSESDDVARVVEILNFIASTIGTNKAFAYGLLRRVSGPISDMIMKLEKAAETSPALMLAVSRLLLCTFDKLGMKADFVAAIVWKKDFWRNIRNASWIDLGSDDKASVMNAKGCLVRCMIVGNPRCMPDNLVDRLLRQVEEALPRPKDSIQCPSTVDMNNFSVLWNDRAYGDNFCLDHRLVNRYVRGLHPELIVSMMEVNKDLSMIDACTQVLKSVIVVLQNRADVVCSMARALRVMNVMLMNDAVPDSSVDTLFGLLDIILGDEEELILSNKNIEALAHYMKHRATDYGLRIIAKLLAAARVEAKFCSMVEMFKRLVDHGVSRMSKSALECGIEMALHLADEDDWIQRTDVVSVFAHLLPTELGVSVVNLFASLCANAPNAKWLEDNDFFVQLEEIPNGTQDNVALWSALFRLMSGLPSSSCVPAWFVSMHFKSVMFFMDRARKANDRSCIRLMITDLMGQIRLDKSRHFIENPGLVSSIKEMMYRTFGEHLKYLQQNLHVKFEGTPQRVDTYNEKLETLYVFKNCLVFMEQFPEEERDYFVKNCTMSPSVHIFMERSLAVMERIVSDESPEYLDIYLPMLLKVFERIMYVFLCAVIHKGVNVINRKERDAVRQVISKMEATIDKTPGLKDAETAKLFDSVRKLLDKTM